ncbi:ABC transporter permease [Roseobacter sp.]|uniref:ABC transporter permease n=1 Tax=Roseobacter sp. TaxID=1907202 RepID=UPI00385C0884
MAGNRRTIRREPAVPLVLRALAMVALVLLLAPVVVVILAGLNAGDHLTFPPKGLSLRWVIAFFQSDAFLPSYLFSLILAVCTMIISTALGTTIALVLARNEFPGKQMARAFFMAPLMLPGIVLGLALYLFYLSSGLGLVRTMPGLVIGHVLVTCPYVVGTVNASLVGFDKSFEEAARSLGASPTKTFRSITLPIISPGIIAGSVFSFIVSFGQFDVSLFLTPPDYNPLPIALYSSLRYTFEPTAAAAGIFAIFLVVVSMLITARLTNLRKLANVNFS